MKFIKCNGLLLSNRSNSNSSIPTQGDKYVETSGELTNKYEQALLANSAIYLKEHNLLEPSTSTTRTRGGIK